MALIKCPECGREISDRAPVCMGCGITKQDIQEMFAMKIQSNQLNDNTVDNEFIHNPTISYITKSDRRAYSNSYWANVEVECRVCKIKYNGQLYSSCPLCESKKKLEKLQKYQALHGTGTVKNRKNKKARYKVGDTIKFGMFDGRQIEWSVLEVNADNILVLSKIGLELRPYNAIKKAISWEACDLRRYLNGEFISKCFDENEQELIVSANLAGDNEKSKGNNDIWDKVFLLSEYEAEKIFENENARKCGVSSYVTHQMNAQLKKINISDSNDRVMYELSTRWWWLRSTAYSDDCAMIVTEDGYIDKEGIDVDVDVTVRPAMWVKMI